MTWPALSILMPSYNAGSFLLEAVTSAVSQLGNHDELLVQDGRSGDGSIEALADAYGADPRIKIVSEPDSGQSDALQRALERAANPHFGWLNADDIYYPGALDAVRRILAEQPCADVVYGSATIFADGDRIIRRVVPAEFSVRALLRHGCHIFSGATFARTELVRAVGGFNRNLHYAMDFDLFFRIAAQTDRCVRVADTLGGLRWHEASKSGSVTLPFFKEAARIRLEYASSPRERLQICGQLGRRLVAAPLIPVRNSRAFSRLRGVKTY